MRIYIHKALQILLLLSHLHARVCVCGIQQRDTGKEVMAGVVHLDMRDTFANKEEEDAPEPGDPGYVGDTYTASDEYFGELEESPIVYDESSHVLVGDWKIVNEVNIKLHVERESSILTGIAEKEIPIVLARVKLKCGIPESQTLTVSHIVQGFYKPLVRFLKEWCDRGYRHTSNEPVLACTSLMWVAFQDVDACYEHG